MLGMFGGMAFFRIGLLLFLPTLLALPPMLSHVAATNSFSAAFHFKDWWKVFRSNIGGFAVALVVAAEQYLMMIFVFQIFDLTIVLCILLPFLLCFLIGYLTNVEILYSQ